MLVILFIIVVIFVIYSFKGIKTLKTPCYSLNKAHSWEYSGEPDSEYMVCSKCGMLPGGDFSEDS